MYLDHVRLSLSVWTLINLNLSSALIFNNKYFVHTNIMYIPKIVKIGKCIKKL